MEGSLEAALNLSSDRLMDDDDLLIQLLICNSNNHNYSPETDISLARQAISIPFTESKNINTFSKKKKVSKINTHPLPTLIPCLFKVHININYHLLPGLPSLFPSEFSAEALL